MRFRSVAIVLSLLFFPVSSPADDGWRLTDFDHGQLSSLQRGPASSFFADKGGVFWNSSNGGKTWQWQSRPGRGWLSGSFRAHPTRQGWGSMIRVSTPEGDDDWRVWLTEDGGKNWRPLNKPEESTVWHAWGHEGQLYVLFRGLYRSNDFGNSWQRVDAFGGSNEPEIVPLERETVLHGWYGADYVYSADGGRSFRILDPPLGNGPWQLAISQQDPNLFAYAKNQVFLRWTRNGGVSFSELLVPEGISSIAFHPRRREHLVVTAGLPQGGVILTSFDAGRTWNRAEMDAISSWNQVWFDPCDDNVMFARHGDLEKLLRSSDGGLSWSIFEVPTQGWVENMHALENTCELLVEARSGLFLASEKGAVWRRGSRGFSGPTAREFVFDPADSEKIYAMGTYGLLESLDGGLSWQRQENELASHAIQRLSVDGAGRIWASTDYSIHSSRDGGNSFQYLDAVGDAFIYQADVVADPFNGGRVLFHVPTSSNSSRWTLSDDAGSTLGEPVLIEFQGEPTPPSYLAFDPYREGTIYALLDGEPGFARSTDGGATFELVGAPGASWQWSSYPEIEISPDGRTFYIWNRRGAGLTGGFWRSTDGGANWSQIYDSIHGIVDLEMDWSRPETLYLAGRLDGSGPDYGARYWRSDDGGETWNRWDEGLSPFWSGGLAQSPHDAGLFVTSTPWGISRRDLKDPGPCALGDPTVLCLHDRRFEIGVRWGDAAGSTGRAERVPSSSTDSGLFYFFAPDNWELLIKVLDGCAFNENWWVATAATTDVDYTLTVQDRVSGWSRQYVNPLGQRSKGGVDVSAFRSCDLPVSRTAIDPPRP